MDFHLINHRPSAPLFDDLAAIDEYLTQQADAARQADREGNFSIAQVAQPIFKAAAAIESAGPLLRPPVATLNRAALGDGELKVPSLDLVTAAKTGKMTQHLWRRTNQPLSSQISLPLQTPPASSEELFYRLCHRCEVLIGEGRIEEAKSFLFKVFRLGSDDSFAWFKLAHCFKQTELWEFAIQSYKRAVQYSPDCAFYHAQLGSTYNYLSRYEEAALSFKQATEKDRLNFDYRLSLGICLMALERYREAQLVLKEALLINPKSAQLHFNLGVVWFKLNSYREAIAAFLQAMNLEPKRALYPMNLGIVYQQMGEKERAQRAFQKAVELEPANATYRHTLGLHYLADHCYVPAIEAFQQACALEPGKRIYNQDLRKALNIFSSAPLRDS